MILRRRVQEILGFAIQNLQATKLLPEAVPLSGNSAEAMLLWIMRRSEVVSAGPPVALLSAVAIKWMRGRPVVH